MLSLLLSGFNLFAQEALVVIDWDAVQKEGLLQSGTVMPGEAEGEASFLRVINEGPGAKTLRVAVMDQPKITAERYVVTGEVRCEGLTFAHEGASEPALSQVSFALPAGKVLGIIGPSASGKTTLARLLVGNLTPM